MGNKTLEAKAKEVLKDKEKEIIDFYNSYDLTKVNNNNKLNKNNLDLPLIKKYVPSQNRHKIYLEIFNIPALFKENYGFIFTINKLSIYIFKFKEKYEKEPNTKEAINKKFEEFLQAILEVEVEKINEILNDGISKEDLIKLKQGIEKLYQYFGPETVNMYYKKIVGVVAGLTGTMAGALYCFLSGFSLSGIGISAVLGCVSFISLSIFIGVVGFFIYEWITKKDEKNILNNAICIDNFFKEIKEFKVESLNGKNLLVLALNNDINKRDLLLLPYNLPVIDSICPIIGTYAEPSSNSYIYYTYLDATEFFIDKYLKKIKEEDYYQIGQHLIKDFEDLKKLNVAEIRYLIDKERRKMKSNSVEKNISNNITSFKEQLPKVPTRQIIPKVATYG